MGVVAVGLWFSWGGLVMSWAGNRPLKPDALHPYAYNNHGIMYVSAMDLAWSNGLQIGALVMLCATLLVQRMALKIDPDFDRRWTNP